LLVGFSSSSDKSGYKFKIYSSFDMYKLIQILKDIIYLKIKQTKYIQAIANTNDSEKEYYAHKPIYLFSEFCLEIL